MVVKEEQERVRQLLKNTITMLCKNSLSFQNKFNIEALIGVTLDDEEVFLVSINDVIRTEKPSDSDPAADSEPSDQETSSRSRQTKKGQNRRKRRHSDSSDEDAPPLKYEFPIELLTAQSPADEESESRPLLKQEQPDSDNDVLFVKQEVDSWEPEHTETGKTFQLSTAPDLLQESEDPMTWSMAGCSYQGGTGAETFTGFDTGPMALPQKKIQHVQRKAEDQEQQTLASQKRLEAPADLFFLDGVHSDSTKKATLTFVRTFRDYLQEKGMDNNFENFSMPQLDKALQTFYVEVRNQKGEVYKKSTMTSIRNGLNRFLQSFNPHIDIIKGQEFNESIKIAKSMREELKKMGKADIQHKVPIREADVRKMYNYFSLADPVKLQHKVIVDLVLHLECRGRKNLRQLTTKDFEILSDASGHRYIQMRQDNPQAEDSRRYLYEIKGHPHCPVASLEKYLSKLDAECVYIFQQPLKNVPENKAVWYSTSPIGQCSLGNILRVISKAANLSAIYTNHCLQTTAATRLDSRALGRHILTVLGLD